MDPAESNYDSERRSEVARKAYNRDAPLYKTVSLYQSDLGKNKLVRIRKADFESEAELERYIDTIKAENATRNADIKLQRKREALKLAAERVNQINEHAPEHDVVELDIKYKAKIPTEQFEIDRSQGNTVAIFGSSKRGKTQLICYLYRKFAKDKDLISTLYAGNPQIPSYNKLGKRLLSTCGFSSKHEAFVEMQQFIQVKTRNQYRFLNIFDDVVDQKHSGIISKLFLSYRNSNISTILSLQYCKLMTPSNRANVNYCAFFGCNQVEDVQRTVELFLRPYFRQLGLETIDDMIAFYLSATRDHGFIWINNLKNTISFHRLDLSKQ